MSLKAKKAQQRVMRASSLCRSCLRRADNNLGGEISCLAMVADVGECGNKRHKQQGARLKSDFDFTGRTDTQTPHWNDGASFVVPRVELSAGHLCFVKEGRQRKSWKRGVDGGGRELSL